MAEQTSGKQNVWDSKGALHGSRAEQGQSVADPADTGARVYTRDAGAGSLSEVRIKARMALGCPVSTRGVGSWESSNCLCDISHETGPTAGAKRAPGLPLAHTSAP